MKHDQKFRMYEDKERQETKLRDKERNSARKAKTQFFRELPEPRKAAQ
jgi:hypothetical protein